MDEFIRLLHAAHKAWVVEVKFVVVQPIDCVRIGIDITAGSTSGDWRPNAVVHEVF